MTPEEARMKIKAAQARDKIRAAQAKTTAPADPKPEPEVSWMDRAGNAALGAAQGSTFSLGDEISGLVNAGVDAAGRAVGVGDQTSTFDSDRKLYRDRLRGTNKAAQEQSVGEYGLAEMAGGLALPGGGAKTALGAAGRMGAAGAASAFGASKDTGWKLAGDTVAGGVLGGALGGGSQKALNIIKAAPGKLKNLAENSAVEVFNPTGPQMAIIQQTVPGGQRALGRTLLDKGIVKFGDSTESSVAKFKPALDDAGKAIGAAYEKADLTSPGGMSTEDLIDALGKHAAGLRKNAVNSPLADEVDKLGVRAINTYGDNLSFKDAHEFKSALADRAFASGGLDPGVSAGLRRDLAGDVSQKVYDSVEDSIGKGGVRDANAMYSMLEKLEDPARSTLAGNKSNRFLGMREFQSSGVGGGIGAAAGFALGGPVGAAIGTAAGTVAGMVASRALKTYGTAMLAAGSDKAAFAAAHLAKAAEAGEPITKIIQQAAALGIPREVIEAMGGSQ